MRCADIRGAARTALASTATAYRPMAVANQPQLRAAIRTTTPQGLRLRLRRHVAKRTALVACSRGDVLGVTLWRHLPGRLYCDWLFVHPSAQGRGLGTAMLERLRALCARRHRRFELDCLDANLPAFAWYLRQGFRPVRRAPPKWWRRAVLKATVLRYVGR